MTTVTLWLLVNVGCCGRVGASVVERFQNADECQRVLRIINDANRYGEMRCIQATVVSGGKP